MRRIISIAFAATAACFSIPFEAEARCREVGRMFFYPDKGVGTDLNFQTDKGRCELGFVSNSTTRFTAARIRFHAAERALKQTGEFNFSYVSKKGDDKLRVEVCGESFNGTGCSLPNYTIIFSAS